MKKAWIYILHTADGSCTVGHTSNLELYLAEHQSNERTRRRWPVELFFPQEIPDKRDVFHAGQPLRGRMEVVTAGGSWKGVKSLSRESKTPA